MSKAFSKTWSATVGVILLLLPFGCTREPFEEELAECEDARHLSTAHLLGSRLVLEPRKGSTWMDLVPSEIPPLASVRTIEGLRAERGAPDLAWEKKGRPFVLYELPEGTLQLGLEASRSGSLDHRGWRLVWRGSPVELAESVSSEALDCIGDLARPNQQVVLLKPDGYPAASFIVEDGLVVEWYWSRRYKSDEE